nr:MAG TPA_asm: Modulator of retrovirus infection [Caudoviricetes sp.]
MDLRSNLQPSRINPWRLVDVALGLLIYLYRN